MKLLKIFLISTLLLTSLSAFTFDKWESGIELSEAIDTARDNNIPIAKEGLGHGSKRFNWQLLKDHKKYRNFYYRQELLGETGKVNLYFTKDSKTLYKVKVRWVLTGEKTKEFQEMLYALLDKKYGNRSIVIPQNLGEYVFFKNRVWKPNSKTEVQTRSSTSMLEVTYLDKEYEKENQNELLQIKEKKKLQIIVKDAGKF